MKPGPREMRSKARGKISKAAFTNREAGPFSKEYLSGRSIYARLQKGEVIQYLLVNKSDGVMVHSADGAESESITAGSNYRSVMAITDRRIQFALGGHEDTILEIKDKEVTGADFQTNPWERSITVTTESKQYKFPVSIEESSDHEDAVKYIQDYLVLETSITETGVTSDSSSTLVSESKVSEPQSPPDKIPPGELQEVNGITDTIERSLRGSGFETRSDLKKASLNDLAEVADISEQVAMRIKLDVGGESRE
ncbi:helix-hairpin-helix domain-containing protein [Halopenitus malekzadehii]|nr:helix-hairpin-helix domain-containing protein [Halopenitus malekzadehii]